MRLIQFKYKERKILDKVGGRMSVKELGDLAFEVISGTVISRLECKKEKESKVGSVNVLTLKAINCGKIESEHLQTIEIVKNVSNEKFTKYGDVIIKMSKPYDSVYIEKEYTDLLVPSFCCLIRGIDQETVDPYYLVGYLNSSFTKEYLTTANGSSAASLLKIKDIKKLPVPLQEITEQRAIGYVFKLCSERQVLLSKMMKHEMSIAENIVMDGVRRGFKND